MFKTVRFVHHILHHILTKLKTVCLCMGSDLIPGTVKQIVIWKVYILSSQQPVAQHLFKCFSRLYIYTTCTVSFQFYFKLVGRHNVSGTQIYKWFRSFCCAQLCFWTDTHTSQGLGFLLRATLVQSKHVQILELTNHIEMRAMFFDMCWLANVTI